MVENGTAGGKIEQKKGEEMGKTIDKRKENIDDRDTLLVCAIER